MAMVIICNHFFPTSIISPRTASTVSNQRHSFPLTAFLIGEKKESTICWPLIASYGRSLSWLRRGIVHSPIFSRRKMRTGETECLLLPYVICSFTQLGHLFQASVIWVAHESPNLDIFIKNR